jgi:hypothetical protein
LAEANAFLKTLLCRSWLGVNYFEIRAEKGSASGSVGTLLRWVSFKLPEEKGHFGITISRWNDNIKTVFTKTVHAVLS